MNSSPAQPAIAAGWLRAIVFLISFLLLFSMVLLLGNTLFSKWLNFSIAAMSAALWLNVIAATIAAFASAWFFRKKVDKKDFVSLGFEKVNFKNNCLTGTAGALAMLGTGSLLLVAFGYLQFTGWQVNSSFLFGSLILMLVVAVEEELVFRGYILNNLMESMNKWLALSISAFLFATIHLGNSGISIVAFAELLVGGMMLGINYIFTNNLWFGIALHFAWNFYQGPILGYKVSGLATPSLMQQQLSGPAWLSGGAFGFEGSILAIVVNLIFVAVLAVIYRKKEVTQAPR